MRYNIYTTNERKVQKLQTSCRVIESMSEYYRAKRTRNLYDPLSNDPFKISRSKLDLFLNCPRCFFIDRRLGVAQPPGFPFNLNSAVDALLKKEFDLYRELSQPHPLFLENNINAIPFKHEKIEEWRDSLRKGIQFHIPNTNIVLTGGVDDLWLNTQTQELIIVDYKATSKQGEVNLDAEWQIGYKRQAEIYQWLFRQNGFRVSNTAYFVYCNGKIDRPRFDKRLDFSITLIPYSGNTDWVLQSILDAHQCLKSSSIPEPSPKCDYCAYVLSINHEVNQHKNPQNTGYLF